MLGDPEVAEAEEEAEEEEAEAGEAPMEDNWTKEVNLGSRRKPRTGKYDKTIKSCQLKCLHFQQTGKNVQILEHEALPRPRDLHQDAQVQLCQGR